MRIGNGTNRRPHSADPLSQARRRGGALDKTWNTLFEEIEPYTDFERRLIEADGFGIAAVPVIDGQDVVGYYFEHGAVRGLRDRTGRLVWGDESAMSRPSLLRPIDLVDGRAPRVPGMHTVGGRSRRGVRITARRAAKGGGRKGALGRTPRAALAEMRAVAESLRTPAARSEVRVSRTAAKARAMVWALREKGMRVVVNLNGEGTPDELRTWPQAVNVNPAPRSSRVPNLLRAPAERLGELFERGTVDRIVSSRISTSTDPIRLARDAAHMLREGGVLVVSTFGPDVCSWGRRFVKALIEAGFNAGRIENVGDVFFTATN